MRGTSEILPSESTMRRIAANLIAFMLDAVTPDEPIIASDEDLEYWGRFFVANRFAERGILFETFMLHPFEIAQAALFGAPISEPRDTQFRPLLPAQKEAAELAFLEMKLMEFGRRREPVHHLRAISRPIDNSDLAFLRRQAD